MDLNSIHSEHENLRSLIDTEDEWIEFYKNNPPEKPIDYFETKTVIPQYSEYFKRYLDEKSDVLVKYYDGNGICGVYCITNKRNGKIYIGSSVNLDVRWDVHKIDLKYHNHHNKPLQSDWDYFGDKNFIFEIIWTGDTTTDRNEILLMEQIMIDKHEPDYNIKKSVDYYEHKSKNESF